MAVNNSNLVINRGSNYGALINVLDENNNKLNITNYTITGKIKKSYGSLNSVSFTCLIIDAANGLISIALPKETTILFEEGRYVYDVISESPSGIVTRIVEGQITVVPLVSTPSEIIQDISETIPSNIRFE